MKDTIKVIIALIFICGSYLIGSDLANEDCNEKVSALNEKMKNKEQKFKELQDSLILVKNQLIECSSKKDDTLKIQFLNSRKEIKVNKMPVTQ